MTERITTKNDFVVSLRNHLMKKYGTQEHYTYGDGDSEGKIDISYYGERAYSLVRKDPLAEKDLMGFCFRKDLCSFIPENASDLIKDVKEFSKSCGLEGTIDKYGSHVCLNLNLEEQSYLITAYIDDGYAGEISVSFMNDFMKRFMPPSDTIKTRERRRAVSFAS